MYSNSVWQEAVGKSTTYFFLTVLKLDRAQLVFTSWLRKKLKGGITENSQSAISDVAAVEIQLAEDQEVQLSRSQQKQSFLATDRRNLKCELQIRVWYSPPQRFLQQQPCGAFMLPLNENCYFPGYCLHGGVLCTC